MNVYIYHLTIFFLQWLVPVMMELLDDKMKQNVTELHKTAWKKLLGVVASITKDEQESNG